MTTTTDLELRPVLRTQAIVSSLLAMTIVATCLFVNWLSHHEPLLGWMQEQRLTRARAGGIPYLHQGMFRDVGGRVFLEEIPAAEYERGGVVLIGSSHLRSAVQTWDLPEDTRGLIHNLGIPAATQGDQSAILRYLVENEELLSGPDGSTRVIFALFFGNAVTPGVGGLGRAFETFVRWHGLFRFESAAAGLHPEEMPSWQRYLIQEKTRCADFLFSCENFLSYRDGEFGFESTFTSDQPRTPDVWRSRWTGLMGREWQRPMRQETAKLGRLVDYIRERGGRVTFVLMPIGSWLADMPHAGFYRELVGDLSEQKGVDLVDLSTAFEDEMFFDATHLTFVGSKRLHEALMPLANEHLDAAGLR